MDGDADGAINDPSGGDEETEFVYGGRASWQLLEEYDAMGTGTTLRASYAYGNYIDEIVEALRDMDNDLVVDDPLYYHQDDLFSVYAITDASGAVVERYDYSDYGEVTVQRADGTAKPEEYWIGNRHTYTGRLVERDTGLLQYRHRYMAPVLGRFVQRDPLGFIDSLNPLQYALSSPISLVDPTGEWVRRTLGIVWISLKQAARCRKEVAKSYATMASIYASLFGTEWDGSAETGLLPGGKKYFSNNPHQHCVWNCRMTLKRGRAYAEKMSLRKEMIDLFWYIEGKRLISVGCWSYLRIAERNIFQDHAKSAWQLSDFRDNATGRSCGSHVACVTGSVSCEKCCRLNGVGPNTPEGPAPGSTRPFGPYSLP